MKRILFFALFCLLLSSNAMAFDDLRDITFTIRRGDAAVPFNGSKREVAVGKRYGALYVSIVFPTPAKFEVALDEANGEINIPFNSILLMHKDPTGRSVPIEGPMCDAIEASTDFYCGTSVARGFARAGSMQLGVDVAIMFGDDVGTMAAGTPTVFDRSCGDSWPGRIVISKPIGKGCPLYDCNSESVLECWKCTNCLYSVQGPCSDMWSCTVSPIPNPSPRTLAGQCIFDLMNPLAPGWEVQGFCKCM